MAPSLVPAPVAAVLVLAGLMLVLALLLTAAHSSGAIELPPALLPSSPICLGMMWPSFVAWVHLQHATVKNTCQVSDEVDSSLRAYLV